MCRSPFLGALCATRGDRDRSRHRARLSGHTITATAHVRVHRAVYVRIKPPSVLNACGSRAHDPLHDIRITRCEHGCPRRPRSQIRRSASSMRSPASPTTTAATPPTTASVPKSLPRCCRPPSCCSHHLQLKQRNPVAERGWVDVSFSSSHRVGSRSMRCLLEVIPRCVVAGRSVFDLSLSGSPLAGSGAPAPPKQKTKNRLFFDRYIAVTCAAGEVLRCEGPR